MTVCGMSRNGAACFVSRRSSSRPHRNAPTERGTRSCDLRGNPPRPDRRQQLSCSGREVFGRVQCPTDAVEDPQRSSAQNRQPASEKHNACGDQRATSAAPDTENTLDQLRAASVADHSPDRQVQSRRRQRYPPDPVRRRCLWDRRDAGRPMPAEENARSQGDNRRKEEVHEQMRRTNQSLEGAWRSGHDQRRRLLRHSAHAEAARPELR